MVGWANARFGWFGVTPQMPSNEMLNYSGVGLAVLSTLVYLFVRTETKSIRRAANDPAQESLVDNDPLNPQNPNNIINNNESNEHRIHPEVDFFDRLSPKYKRVIGISLSLVSGVLYGLTFTPILYARDNYGGSSNNLDYVFSLYTGILLSSMLSFIVYSVVKRNNPTIYPQIILPGLLSGWMWGVANNLFFVASNILSQAVTFVNLYIFKHLYKIINFFKLLFS